jgi:hypothetical protein
MKAPPCSKRARRVGRSSACPSLMRAASSSASTLSAATHSAVCTARLAAASGAAPATAGGPSTATSNKHGLMPPTDSPPARKKTGGSGAHVGRPVLGGVPGNQRPVGSRQPDQLRLRVHDGLKACHGTRLSSVAGAAWPRDLTLEGARRPRGHGGKRRRDPHDRGRVAAKDGHVGTRAERLSEPRWRCGGSLVQGPCSSGGRASAVGRFSPHRRTHQRGQEGEAPDGEPAPSRRQRSTCARGARGPSCRRYRGVQSAGIGTNHGLHCVRTDVGQVADMGTTRTAASCPLGSMGLGLPNGRPLRENSAIATLSRP